MYITISNISFLQVVENKNHQLPVSLFYIICTNCTQERNVRKLENWNNYLILYPKIWMGQDYKNEVMNFSAMDVKLVNCHLNNFFFFWVGCIKGLINNTYSVKKYLHLFEK